MDDLQHGTCFSYKLWSWSKVSLRVQTRKFDCDVFRNKGRVDDIVLRRIQSGLIRI